MGFMKPTGEAATAATASAVPAPSTGVPSAVAPAPSAAPAPGAFPRFLARAARNSAVHRAL